MPVTVGEIALVMFVGMGPIKVIVFYLGAIRDATPAVAREVAWRAVSVATITALSWASCSWRLPSSSSSSASARWAS